MYIIMADDTLVHQSGFTNKDYLAISAALELEFNRSGSLSFTLPPNNYAVKNNVLKKLTTEIRVYKNNQNNLIWKGRILDSSKDFMRRMSYTCEGWMSVLCDSVVRPEGDPEAGITANPGDYFISLINKHNAQVGPSKSLTPHVKGFSGESTGNETVPPVHEQHAQISWGSQGTEVRTCQEYLNRCGYSIGIDGIFGWETYNAVTSFQSAYGLGVDGIVGPMTWYALEEAIAGKKKTPLLRVTFPVGSYETTLDYIQTNFLSNEEVGGRIWVDDNDIYFYADGFEEYGNQAITFGENLLELTEKIDASELYTVIIPEGKDGLLLSPDYIEDANAVALFGKIYHHESFSDIETLSELRTKATETLNQNIEENMTIDISAFDLSLIDPEMDMITVGEFIRIQSIPHGIDKYWICSKAHVDLCNPANSTCTLGVNPESITSKQAKMYKSV